MNIKLIIKLLNAIYVFSLPILSVFCLFMYWNSEIIVDKMHYGFFLVCFLILMLDISHRDNNNKNNTHAT